MAPSPVQVVAGYEGVGLKPPVSLVQKVSACSARLAEEMEAKDRREGRLQRGLARLKKVRGAGSCSRSRHIIIYSLSCEETSSVLC